MLGFFLIITESMLTLVRPADSPLGQRVVAFVPFLRSRYGRPIVYALLGLTFWLLCEDGIEQWAFMTLFLCGLSYGAIAMQPGNPMDYRGF